MSTHHLLGRWKSASQHGKTLFPLIKAHRDFSWSSDTVQKIEILLFSLCSLFSVFTYFSTALPFLFFFLKKFFKHPRRVCLCELPQLRRQSEEVSCGIQAVFTAWLMHKWLTASQSFCTCITVAFSSVRLVLYKHDPFPTVKILRYSERVKVLSLFPWFRVFVTLTALLFWEWEQAILVWNSCLWCPDLFLVFSVEGSRRFCLLLTQSH